MSAPRVVTSSARRRPVCGGARVVRPFRQREIHDQIRVSMKAPNELILLYGE